MAQGRLKSEPLGTVVVTATGAVFNGDGVSLPAAPNGWVFKAEVTIAGAAVAHDELGIQTSFDGTNWTDLCIFNVMGVSVGVINYMKILGATAEAIRSATSSVTVGNVQHMVGPLVRGFVNGAPTSQGSVKFDVCAL